MGSSCNRIIYICCLYCLIVPLLCYRLEPVACVPRVNIHPDSFYESWRLPCCSRYCLMQTYSCYCWHEYGDHWYWREDRWPYIFCFSYVRIAILCQFVHLYVILQVAFDFIIHVHCTHHKLENHIRPVAKSNISFLTALIALCVHFDVFRWWDDLWYELC